MSISEKRRIELEAMRQNQILSVALGLFYRKGYAGTTVDEIAKAANMSKGLVYRYFNSKADILLAYHKALDRCFTDALTIASPIDSIRKAAETFLIETDETVIEHPLRALLLVYVKGGFDDDRLQEALPADMARAFYCKQFQRGIELGEFLPGDAEEYGAIFWQYLIGYTVDLMLQKRTPSNDEVVRRVNLALSQFQRNPM